MDPVTIALLVKIAPYLLQGAVQLQGSIHQDITGYQAILLAQQVTQQEYYKTLRVYYLTQSRKKKKRK